MSHQTGPIVPSRLHRHLGPSLEHSVPVDIAPTRQCVSIKSFGEPSAGRSENLVERQSSLTRSGMQQSASFHSALVRFPQDATRLTEMPRMKHREKTSRAISFPGPSAPSPLEELK